MAQQIFCEKPGECYTLLLPVTRDEWFSCCFIQHFDFFFRQKKQTFKTQLVCVFFPTTLAQEQITLMRMLHMCTGDAQRCHRNMWWNRVKHFSTLDSATWCNTGANISPQWKTDTLSFSSYSPFEMKSTFKISSFHCHNVSDPCKMDYIF